MVKQPLLKRKSQTDEVPDSSQSSPDAPGVTDLQACIAHRAYELYEQEGCCHGHDLEHWLEAEQQVLGG